MQHVVILGTGGTIAGKGTDPSKAWAYEAAQLGVSELVAAVPELAGIPLKTRQIAQIDSKDMGWQVWRALGRALADELARADVAGVVITHGTDTLEETAYLLHRLADGAKPIVLTAAMRPATAPDADGPANLRDAARLVLHAASNGLGGVVAVMHGRVWAGSHLRKRHSCALDAFDGGGHGPLALVDAQGAFSDTGAGWPEPGRQGWHMLDGLPPRVEIVHSHAEADGWLVDAALAASTEAQPLRGLIVACTGHGTIHRSLLEALDKAARQGVCVRRSSRAAQGGVTPREGDVFAACGDLTPAQARVALMLDLLSGEAERGGARCGAPFATRP